jgi:hypothetical protein
VNDKYKIVGNKNIICKVCGSSYVVNKTHKLCYKHNKDRLNSRSGKKKKKKTIRKKSEKQKLIDKEYKAVLRKIDYTRKKVCSGCGKKESAIIKLSHSHIISRSDCKRIGRPELIYDERNITYHCLDWLDHEGCHRKWEDPKKRKTLLDYERNIKIIEELAPEILWKYKISNETI